MYYDQESGALVNLTHSTITSFNSLCYGHITLERSVNFLKIPVKIDRLFEEKKKTNQNLTKKIYRRNIGETERKFIEVSLSKRWEIYRRIFSKTEENLLK